MKLTVKGIQFTQNGDEVTFELEREEVEEMLLDLGILNVSDSIKKNLGVMGDMLFPLISKMIKVPSGEDTIEYLLVQGLEYALNQWEEKEQVKIERSGHIHVEEDKPSS